MTMLAPAHVASYTNPPPMMATQHPSALMQNIYEMYGTMPIDPGFNHTGIDSRLVHELTLQQVVGQRVITQETQIVRRQLSMQLLGIRVLAPIRQVNALKIRFPYMEYNPTLIGLVPERGRVRGTSFTQRVVEKELDRYANGDHFGLELLSSEIGPQVLDASRNTNVDGLMMTLEFQVWVEARRSQDIAWEMEKQLMESNITQHSMSVMETRAKLHWALFQLNPRALYHLNAKTQEYQSKYGGRGNAWFIHMKSERYLALVPDERIQYFQAGPGGPNLLESMPGDGVRAIGGKPVFVMQNMDIYGLGAMDVLENQAEYAEYYNMLDPFKDTDYEDYTSDSRSIHLIDLDRGCWERFTLMQALEASGRYDEGGNPVDVLDNISGHATREAFASPVDQFDSSYYITSSGQQRLVKYMGQIEQRAFSSRSVLLLATSVVRRLTGLSATPQAAVVHMNTLAKAVTDCHEVDPGLPEVKAYVSDMLKLTGGDTTVAKGDDVTEWKRNGQYGSFRLPTSDRDSDNAWPNLFEVVPFGGNYAMFKAVGVALRSKPKQEDFQATYRLNYERATQIARSLDVFDEIARALERLLPGSALLEKEYASPWFHSPTPQHTLFENTIGQSRLPLFVRAMDSFDRDEQQPAQQDQSRASSQAPSRGSSPPPLAVQKGITSSKFMGAPVDKRRAKATLAIVEEARSQALGLSMVYAGDLMARFTGRLVTKKQQDARPASIHAKITPSTESTDDDAVFVDPRPTAGAKPFTELNKLVESLPPFAQTALRSQFADAVGVNVQVVARPDDSPVKEMYLKLVALLFNYRAASHVANVEKTLLAERNRAIALLVASSVNNGGSAAEVAQRLKLVFDHLLNEANGAPIKMDAPLDSVEIEPIFGAGGSDTLATIRSRLGAFLKAQPSVFEQTGVQRIAAQLPAILAAHQDLLQVVTAKAAEVEAKSKSGEYISPKKSHYEASEYLRTPLTFGPWQFQQLHAEVLAMEQDSENAPPPPLPYALPADPLDPRQSVPLAMFGHYVDQMKRNDANTPPALYDAQTVAKAATALSLYNRMRQVVANTRDSATYKEFEAAPHRDELQFDHTGRVVNWAQLTPVRVARAQTGPTRVDVYSGRTYVELANDDQPMDEDVTMDYASMSLFQQMNKAAMQATRSTASPFGAENGDIVNMVSVSFATNWAAVSANAPDALTELVAKVYLCQKHHKRVFDAAFRNSTLFPKRFLLFRRARFSTLSALFAQVGGEAMETFITFPRFYYGSDPSVQEYEYSFHFWAGAVVKRPELLYWADHVQIIKYHGGWGMRAMPPADVRDTNSIMSPGSRSIFVYEEPYEPIFYEDQLPITGRRDDYSPKVAANFSENTSLLVGNAYAANILFRWKELDATLQENEAASVPQERPWLSAVQNIFPIAHRGTARFYGKTQKFLHHSKGWFPSEIVTPRMVDVFNGGLESFQREDLAGFVPVSA